MRSEIISACTSYGTCAVLALQEVNWAAVGAAVLLIARLMKDVPEAIDYVTERMNRKKKKTTKKRKKTNGKSKR